MKVNPIELLNIYLNQDKKIFVGRLALKNRKIYFEYDESFIGLNIPLSPFMLPLKSGVQICEDNVFMGLFGVFNDSLPDGWGKLLLDRQIEKHGIHRNALTPLDRLAHTGPFTMGALTYEPALSSYDYTSNELDLDKLAFDSQIILKGEPEEVFEELLYLNGSSSGARPKIMAGIDKKKESLIHGLCNLPQTYDHWMIKFPSNNDPKDIGAIEYAYSLMAKDSGLEMPETHLFQTKQGNHYFGCQRFDRCNNKPIHMHSLCGLIHADHRTPSLDYEMILRVTLALTKNIKEVEKIYRLACFNVMAHNRDDHSKNFSFLLKDDHEWILAPAYDLTFSFGPGNEQSTLVMGEGKNPNFQNLKDLATKFNISHSEDILDQVYETISKWEHYAEKTGVSLHSTKMISEKLKDF